MDSRSVIKASGIHSVFSQWYAAEQRNTVITELFLITLYGPKFVNTKQSQQSFPNCFRKVGVTKCKECHNNVSSLTQKGLKWHLHGPNFNPTEHTELEPRLLDLTTGFTSLMCQSHSCV